MRVHEASSLERRAGDHRPGLRRLSSRRRITLGTQRVTNAIVITSYSIHYTKLYDESDRCPGRDRQILSHQRDLLPGGDVSQADQRAERCGNHAGEHAGHRAFRCLLSRHAGLCDQAVQAVQGGGQGFSGRLDLFADRLDLLEDARNQFSGGGDLLA